MGLISLLLVACLLLITELLHRAWRSEKESAQILTELNIELLHTREIRKQADTLRRIAQAQSLTEAVVHGGTATVRAVHKGIASIPFGILEAIPATSLSAKSARKTHDAIADGVYSTITGVNRFIGEATRKALRPDKPEVKSGIATKEISPPPKPPASDKP